MAYTQGLSYYETDVLTGNSITFGFDALTSGDISVVGINETPDPDTRHVLTPSSDYVIDLENQTITCQQPNWSDLSVVSSNGVDKIRVYRTTTTASLIDFQNGGVLTEGDLDTAYKQSLYACQEVSENASGISDAGVQSVTGGMIADYAITEQKLASYSVTQSKMAYGSVGSSNIAANAVSANALASNSVSTAKIQNNAVDDDKLATDAVTTVKIVDDAVTYAKVDTATKTEMQGQSAAGIVTPDVIKYSPFAPRCYGSVTFDAATPIVSASYNVQSVADTSTSQRTVTFSNALTDTDYVVIVTAGGTTSGLYATVTNKTVNSFIIDSASGFEGTGLKFDFVVFGSNLLL